MTKDELQARLTATQSEVIEWVMRHDKLEQHCAELQRQLAEAWNEIGLLADDMQNAAARVEVRLWPVAIALVAGLVIGGVAL